MIKLLLLKTTETIDLTKLVESVTWSGDYKSSCRKLEFNIVSSAFDINIAKVDMACGNMVMFYEDNKELFRGFIVNLSKDSSSNSIQYTAFDYGSKLNDIKISYNIKGKTANEIYEKVLTDYGLAKGDIVKVDAKVDKVFIGTTIYEMIMTMYTEASKKNGKKYMMYSEQGKFYAKEKGVIKLQLMFEETKNLLNSSFSETTNSMVNKVIIVDKNGNKSSEVKNENDMKLYGLFQEVLKIEEGKDSAVEAKAMLKGIERTCSLEGIGDTTCTTGFAVTVKDSYTGLVGLFYIDTDSHKWENGSYTISLGLNFKNIMNEVSAGEVEQKEETSTSSGGSSLNGKEVNALFTAYYPANNAMEGGFLDAQGKKLNPKNNTCAAPKSIPFGTKIQIKGTGTSRDNETYRVNDRGGVITIKNGVYHFDILMSSRAECNAWGRKNGKAIIGDGSGYSSSGGGSASSKAQKAVDLAHGKLGKSYVRGGNGPNVFDCSGLVKWCYGQLGINIPRTSRQQSTYGKSVAFKDLIPGDLVFYDTAGGGYVSHVGMYIGGGKMIHAPKPKDVVQIQSITINYYTSKFKGARRVS